MPTRDFTEEQIPEIAQLLLENKGSKVLCLKGEMGSGKTTLIKAMVEHLGGGSMTSSPTFNIVNEYADVSGQLLAYHFDCYRLEDVEEAFDIGIEEYFAKDTWIFIEWPEIIMDLIPESARQIELEFLDEKTRRIHY